MISALMLKVAIQLKEWDNLERARQNSADVTNRQRFAINEVSPTVNDKMFVEFALKAKK